MIKRILVQGPAAPSQAYKIKFMFYDFFNSFYFAILIITTFCGLVFFKALQKPFALIATLIWLTLLNEIAAHILMYGKHANAVVYNSFIPVEFFIYTLVFKSFLRNKRWSIVVFCCFALLVLQEAASAFYMHDFYRDQFVETATLENVLLVFFSLGLFLQIRNSDFSKSLKLEGVFWFNSAVLLYYGYNVIFWSFFGPSLSDAMYSVNYVLSGLLYLVYAFCIYLNYLNGKRK